MISIILNIVLILVFPFILIGSINKTKAFWAGRKGASVIQPLYDFIRLVKKGQVISRTTSFVFVIAPTISLASLLVAASLIPVIDHRAIFGFEGDFILFAYILALGKFFSLIGAMDTGSSFEGMGASREASFSTLVEPAFIIIMASLVAITGNYSFESLALMFHKTANLGYLIIVLSCITLFIMMLVEGCRLPVDDPSTHLELTMIHEVMILDNSGIDLAFLTYGVGLKMMILSSLIASIIIPSGLSLSYSVLLYVAILFFLAGLIGTIESSMARLRMTHVLEFVFVLCSISLIVLSLTMLFLYGDIGSL
jgi:formate hydrogenlyase subunit 4